MLFLSRKITVKYVCIFACFYTAKSLYILTDNKLSYGNLEECLRFRIRQKFFFFFILFILVGWDRSLLSVAWPTRVQLVFFICSGVSKIFGAQGSPSSGSLLNLLSPRF